MDRYKAHKRKETLEAINSSYYDWLEFCNEMPNKKQIMAKQIALLACNYFTKDDFNDFSKEMWYEKFKDEELVLIEIKNQENKLEL